jgi:hypothetical protein
VIPPSNSQIGSEKSINKNSISINSEDTSISHFNQLDLAVPPATISQLSSGQFVGLVADDPNQIIPQKAFHCQIQNDHAKLKKEEDDYIKIPKTRNLFNDEVSQNYLLVKRDISELIELELERMMDTPALTSLIIKQS